MRVEGGIKNSDDKYMESLFVTFGVLLEFAVLNGLNSQVIRSGFFGIRTVFSRIRIRSLFISDSETTNGRWFIDVFLVQSCNTAIAQR